MRVLAWTFLVAAPLGGCSVITERSSLGYGDYVALSCDQLGEQALRLMREIGDRSEHLVDDDHKRRERAKRGLKLVKRVSADKQCNA